MKRNIRVWLLATCLLITVSSADAQSVGKVPQLGLLSPGTSEHNPQIEGFQQALHDLGYVEGRNIHIEYRFAQGKDELLSELAAELIRLKVDVITPFSHHAALIVKNATTSIPIVFAFVNDPVGVGLVPSLARPGGNITGVSLQGLDLIGSCLELLKETVPKVDRLVYLRNPVEPYSPIYWKEVQSVSRALGIKLVSSLEATMTLKRPLLQWLDNIRMLFSSNQTV